MTSKTDVSQTAGRTAEMGLRSGGHEGDAERMRDGEKGVRGVEGRIGRDERWGLRARRKE